jgi:hypothetical protein
MFDSKSSDSEVFEEESSQTSRRDFIKRIGIAGIVLAISSRVSLLASVGHEFDELELWRHRVTGFVFTICETKNAKAIISNLERASISLAPASTNFHDSFSAPYVFGEPKINPEEVICGNGFEVNRYPFYDVKCPCRNVNDLNAFEIVRITDAAEIERYGCVLAPASARTAMGYSDYREFSVTAPEYELDATEFKVLYKRLFTGKGKSYMGFHIAHKTKVGRTGKPLKDLLLSSIEFLG